MLVLVRLVQGIKHAGLRSSQTKSCERRACTRPSDTRNQVGRTSSIQYEDARKENLSSSVQYEESIWREFVCPVRSHAKGDLVLVRLVQGIMQAGLRLSGTKSCEMKACPRPCDGITHARLRLASIKSCERSSSLRPSSMRNQVSGTSSVH